MRLAALFDPLVAQITAELGKFKRASAEKARRLLGWAPCLNEDAVVATVENLLRLGLLGNLLMPA